jgi:hypothetical protein
VAARVAAHCFPNEMRTMTAGTENMVVVLWTLALLAAGAIVLALFWV